ncbi:Transcription elongation factor S-II [Paramyrothecium foliicola]|nr:Transcription elongation factor S-II [Paramyrothecium foliicola]
MGVSRASPLPQLSFLSPRLLPPPPPGIPPAEEIKPAMDQRELESRVKALTKCVAANEPAENALKLLESLKKDASPTEEMLRATRAGVFVGKLRANPNKEIARAASELVAKWKKLVEQEKNSKLHKSKIGSPAPAPASSPASAPAASSGGAKRTFKGDPEKRRYDADGVDIKRTESTVRNQCIGLIYNGLAYRSTDSESDVIARSVAVENAAFVFFKGEGPEYKKKIRSLFANLKNKSNKELGRRVMSGDVTAEKFVAMTDEELKSEVQRKIELELEKENMKNAQVPMAEKSISDSLECSKCKKKKVSYTQAQTRSADEPMTTFCECMNCGNRWKPQILDALPELAEVPRARVAQDGDDLAARRQGHGRHDRGDTVDGTAAADKDAVILDQPARHPAGLIISHAHSVVNQIPAGLEVLRDAVDADALHDGVDLLPAPRALPLGGRVHDAVLDLVVEAAALGVRQHHFEVGEPLLLLEVLGDARDGSARAGAGDERVDLAAGLGVLDGTPSSEVDEVVRAGDGGDGDALNVGSQVEQQIRLLVALVIRHAYVCLVAECPGQTGQRYASATDGALVDGVAVVGSQQALRLSLSDHVQGNTILGAVPGAIEQLGLGHDRATRGIGDRLGRRAGIGLVVLELDRRAPEDAAAARGYGLRALGLAAALLVLALEVRVKVLEAEGQEDAGCEGQRKGRGAIRSGMIAQ